MAVTRSNSNSNIGGSSVSRNTRGGSKTRKGGTITKRGSAKPKKSVKEGFTQGINPTEGESIFEAYLSVLIELLGTQEIYQSIVKTYSDTVTIQVVKGKDDLPKPEEKSTDPIIYYYDNLNDKGTHYRVYSYEINTRSRNKNTSKKWTIIDPYDLYQKKNSHGFCQMFAFFIATKNTQEFIDKTIKKSPRKKVKDIHTHNTFECLQKTIALMEEEKFPKEIMGNLEKEFKVLQKKTKYGISRNMKFADFIRDLKDFKNADVDNYIADLDRPKPTLEED